MNPHPQDIRRAADIFKVLSHPDRLRLICRLFDAPPTPQKDLVRDLGWPQSSVARHLGALRDCGLVVAQRRGKEVLYEIGSPVARQLMSAVCQWVHPETGERFEVRYESAEEVR